MDKEAIKVQLLKSLQETQMLVDRYEELTKPIAPENAIGRVSRMDAINNKSVNEAALNKARIKLRNIQLALERLDDADFGICVSCKQPIPEGRILLMPQTIRCVRCSR